jgi:hypothetical protein
VSGSRRTFLRLLAAAFGMALASRSLDPSIAVAQALPDFVVPRHEWSARPPGPGRRSHRIDRITLHHTGPPSWYGVPPTPAYLRAIQSFHMGPDRRWPDIAYHLLIDLDGIVWEGRSLTVAGDTATNYDPAGHALIAVLGDYSRQQPTVAQRDAIVDTVGWLVDSYGCAPETLRGHRDYAATACPGDYLAALLDEIRALIGN